MHERFSIPTDFHNFAGDRALGYRAGGPDPLHRVIFRNLQALPADGIVETLGRLGGEGYFQRVAKQRPQPTLPEKWKPDQEIEVRKPLGFQLVVVQLLGEDAVPQALNFHP